ncbi:hypothetical protein RJ639_025461 [Escallonia herrerae]|uniref:RWP-RK domain-containing protein n=1 Tax=Escallonia herrerae TaxID=1293975 RepID=A0AA88SPN3_9ASTE|nr:hypothetical protein RJ639_025461 [Escallonia herrerae]
MMNAQQVQAQAQLQNLGSATAQAPPPSFDQVSKLFSIPLSEAADSLVCVAGTNLKNSADVKNFHVAGVSAGVLKKICQENGLLRWPHRKEIKEKDVTNDALDEEKENATKKVIEEIEDEVEINLDEDVEEIIRAPRGGINSDFVVMEFHVVFGIPGQFLSGKSIEEIKKDAAREKTKELAELAKAARERNEARTTSAVSASLIKSSDGYLNNNGGINLALLYTEAAKVLSKAAKPLVVTSADVVRGSFAKDAEFYRSFIITSVTSSCSLGL